MHFLFFNLENFPDWLMVQFEEYHSDWLNLCFTKKKSSEKGTRIILWLHISFSCELKYCIEKYLQMNIPRKIQKYPPLQIKYRLEIIWICSGNIKRINLEILLKKSFAYFLILCSYNFYFLKRTQAHI